MSRNLTLPNELLAPLETVKDQSLLKVRVLTFALFLGHPFYYWAWAYEVPQPYESPVLRTIASVLGLLAFIYSVSRGLADRRTVFWFGLASAFGTVFLAFWFYVANGGNMVWLASSCVMMMLYFTMTDWRIATVVTLGSMLLAWLLVPALRVGVYATGGISQAFDFKAWLIIGFTLATSLLTRFTDVSRRVVQMRSQLRALGVTAHEVRTPIAGLLLLSTSLQERLRQVVRQHPNDDVTEAAGLADDLVATCQDANQLVATHLANANPFKPFANRAKVQSSSVVSEAVHSFERGSGARAGLVDLQVIKDFEIMADRGAVRQALVNLLNNALRAVVLQHRTPSQGSISVVVDFDGAGIISVSDLGKGMERWELREIFQPFYTGDPDHGHGLGLTFVQSVANAYHGTIDVRSQPGVGTTFTMRFEKATAV